MTTSAKPVERAQALLAERISVIEAATKTASAVDQAQAALDQARRDHADAWRTALKAGWSATELKKMGLPAPTAQRQARGTRPRPSASPEPSPQVVASG